MPCGGFGAFRSTCVTVSVDPLTVIVPVRSAPVLAVTWISIVPSPVPVALPLTVSQAAPELAVQVQVDAASTKTLADPAASSTMTRGGVSVTGQFGADAACVTVTGIPATVTVVDRDAAVVFAATLSA